MISDRYDRDYASSLRAGQLHAREAAAIDGYVHRAFGIGEATEEPEASRDSETDAVAAYLTRAGLLRS